MRKPYRRNQDPYWTYARFNSIDADGQPVKEGDKIFYYPASRTVLTGEKAEQGARDLESEQFDQIQYDSQF